MVLFSWKKVFYHSKGKPTEIVRIIRMLTYKMVPRNEFDKIYKYSMLDFSGSSFLVNPEGLFENQYRYSNRDMAIYISLASLRPSAAYLAQGVLSLDLLHSPIGDPRERLENKKLLIVKNNRIYFLYEEKYKQSRLTPQRGESTETKEEK